MDTGHSAFPFLATYNRQNEVMLRLDSSSVDMSDATVKCSK